MDSPKRKTIKKYNEKYREKSAVSPGICSLFHSKFTLIF